MRPNTKRIKALSTNAICYGAHVALAGMAGALKQPEAEGFRAKAAKLKRAVHSRFWLPEKGRCGYLVLDDGRLDESQEGMGVAYALLFGVCDGENAAALLRNTELTPHGITCVGVRGSAPVGAEVLSAASRITRRRSAL